MAVRKNHRVKYRLTCTAPEELTEFNKEYNKQIEAKCFQKIKFQPYLTCMDCEFLNTKRLT
jgi:hypothetical protein